ncbi:MAG: 3-hydroxyacyl-CoA dehydrogenase family protein [Candidatus Acidiferrales bacterium]
MNVNTIGVIGAGSVGRRIARAALLGGYRTILEDVSSDALDQGMAHIRQSIDESVARERVTRPQAVEALARLSAASRVDDVCREADLLIETAPEEMEVKLEIFTIFDKFAKPDAILASHTELSITDIAAITFRTENCAGMRFIFGAPTENRLEIVRGADTSDATIATCLEVGHRLGMHSVVVPDSPELDAGGESGTQVRAKGVAE